MSLLEKELEGKDPEFKTRGLVLADPGADDDEDQPKTRQCTDAFCLIIFIAFWCGMGYILNFALTEGNIAKVIHGFDWEGNICGVDHGDNYDVRDQPYVYWCVSEDKSLSDPICVKECPSSSETKSRCPAPITAASIKRSSVTHAPGSEDPDVRSIEITRHLVLTNDVETEDVLGMYCLPTKSQELMSQILDFPGVSSYSRQLFMAFDAIQKGWRFLIGVIFLAVMCGYVFLILLKYLVKPFIIILFGLLFVALFSLGVWGIICATAGDLDKLGLPEHWVQQVNSSTAYNPVLAYTPPANAHKINLGAGLFFLIVSVLFAVCWCFAGKAIDLTCEAISRSCDSVAAMPTLLLQPLLEVLLHLLVLIFAGFGLLWVMSLGHVVTSDPMADHDIGLPVNVEGMYRTFSFTRNQWYMLGYWVFGSLWLYELVVSMGQYAVSHAVVVHRLAKDANNCLPLSRGYANGIIFHLGTLAFASFIIGMLRFLMMVLAYIAKQAQQGPDGKVNIAVKALVACCTCCLGCLTQIMRLVNEMVYVDVAISGRGYCSAAWNVWKMTIQNPVTAATVVGSVRAIRWVGIFIIGGGGTFLSYQILSNPERIEGALKHGATAVQRGASALHINVPGSEHVGAQALFTSNVLGMTAASGFICFMVAATFMNIFVITAQALAYIEVWKGSRSDK
mmetsp:Transcript_21343/g.47216  ORF Transcript_21343/g.47216 Transcript_21343/m.47216 type:complete len:677 (-) Transcript_21343:97-2127(-)